MTPAVSTKSSQKYKQQVALFLPQISHGFPVLIAPPLHIQICRGCSVGAKCSFGAPSDGCVGLWTVKEHMGP